MLNERKLSKDGQGKLKQVVGTIAGDTKRRRKLVKKHGKDAAKIVQGIAVKAAQKYEEKQAETMDQDKIKEAVKDALKNPKKADLNKDGELSDYERKRGAAIEKAMAKESIDEMDDKMDLTPATELVRTKDGFVFSQFEGMAGPALNISAVGMLDGRGPSFIQIPGFKLDSFTSGLKDAIKAFKSMNEGILDEVKKLTYDNFVQMVRDEMMAGAAPDEYPSDERVRDKATDLYNQYLQGASVEDLFEVEEGIFDRFKKKSSSEERPIGTGTTMDGGFGFASDESYELLKKLAKEMGGKLTGMGENERYISFGLETIENDRYTEREYYYDKETKKVIKKKSSNNERPMGTGTTMDGDFGFASDKSIKLIKNLTKKMDGELSGMGENERYISFSLATTEDDTYTERDYYYDKETGKIIEKGISKQLPENVNEGDLDLGHQDNEPHMLKADLYRIGKYAMELYQMVDGFEGQGEVDFPHWWQSKIIKSKDALVGAKHYLDFELKEPQIDAMVDVAQEEDVIDEAKYDGSIQIPSQKEVDAFFKSKGDELHYLANKPVEKWDEYDYSNWKKLTSKRQPTFEGIAEKLAKQLKSR